MSSSPRVASVAALLFALPPSQTAPPSAPPSPTKANERVTAALKWLPDDTETVIVANGPFRLPPPEPANAQDPDAFYKKASVSFADLVRATTFMLAGGLDNGTATPTYQRLCELDFEFALEGSRSFRAPHGVGVFSYEGALVAAVAESGQERLHAIVDLVAKAASEHVDLGGTPVSVIAPPKESGLPSLYAASPRPGLLCVASDRAYMESLLQRMSKPGNAEAFPADLPEWKQVDATASVFAIRHFRKGDVSKDPTSPLQEQTSANRPDMKAIGVVFECREGKRQTAVARYLSGAADPITIVRPGWSMKEEGLDPQLSVKAPGVVEISQSVDAPLPASRFFFVLIGYLGHAFYV